MGGLRVIQLGVLALGLALTAGCSSKPSQPQVGGSTASKAERARRDAEALAVAAATGGADAQALAVPEAAVRRDRGGLFNVAIDAQKAAATVTFSGPPPPPIPPPLATPQAAFAAPRMPAPTRPSSQAVVREHVTSGVSASEAEADADALAQARDAIERKLGELDPPVRYRPSAAEVKAEFIRKDSRAVRAPDADRQKLFAKEGLVGNFVFVEYDVEVSAEQVRELRSQERAGAGLRVLGMLVAVALTGFLFLRADEWTRGYLTSWLALGAVALAGGAAAFLICV